MHLAERRSTNGSDSSQAMLAAYRDKGFMHLAGFLPVEVATGFLARLQTDLARQGVSLDTLRKAQPLLRRPAAELYGYHYAPLATFHWGLTPAVEALLQKRLLPTYAYFRLYQEGDICRVHGDRAACEHSMSLTLAYSDDRPWALEVGSRRIEVPYQRADDNFASGEEFSSSQMAAGDAVLYQGVHHHHGRTAPNPNRWSAHAFLHWVDRDGPYADTAFDRQPPPAKVTF